MSLTFNFNEDAPISFEHQEKGLYVNATEMAKMFDKRIDHFLKTQPTQDFLKVMEFPPTGGNSKPLSKDEIMITRGVKGTWMHRILAYKFAAWLSPEFELWVYSTIDEILFGKYRELEEKLRHAAKLDNEKKEIEERLMDNNDYIRLKQIEFEKRQAQNKSRKLNHKQLQMFKDQNN